MSAQTATGSLLGRPPAAAPAGSGTAADTGRSMCARSCRRTNWRTRTQWRANSTTGWLRTRRRCWPRRRPTCASSRDRTLGSSSIHLSRPGSRISTRVWQSPPGREAGVPDADWRLQVHLLEHEPERRRHVRAGRHGRASSAAHVPQPGPREGVVAEIRHTHGRVRWPTTALSIQKRFWRAVPGNREDEIRRLPAARRLSRSHGRTVAAPGGRPSTNRRVTWISPLSCTSRTARTGSNLEAVRCWPNVTADPFQRTRRHPSHGCRE